MNKYQFKTKTPSGLGNVYYYCYANDRFETYLNIKNIKYKKNWKNQGKNEFEQLQQELQRKDNIIENITKYVRTFKTDEITDRELCILNDILLITEEKENIVARLKEKQ